MSRKNENIDLSIIIPAYNAEPFIERCLNSIYTLNWDEHSFEVIVVDDCSTDCTLQKLNYYASSKENMQVFHQQNNQRQGAARNRGLKLAKGQYVIFVDADDIVLPDLVGALKYALSTETQATICNYDVVTSYNGEIEHRRLNAPCGIVYSGYEFLEQIYNTSFCCCPINYLWDRDFLVSTEAFFIEGRRMEDIDWIEKTLAKVKSIACAQQVIYKVIGHDQSTTRTTDIGTISDWLHFCCRRLEFAESLKDKLPRYYQKIIDDTPRFVINNTRFRLLTRFSCKELHQIYARAEKKSIKFLRGYNCWPLSTRVFLSFPVLTQILAFIIYPMAESSRIIYRKIHY